MDTLERLTRSLGDRYEVERQVGEGGMATVYVARDLKHNREVAIKVLRPELAASVGTKRFLQEIDIAARLQHPHVLPVYDSGEADGLLYYVMPFVEGESLKDRLARERQIPWRDAVAIAREVASALDYANRQGVVHRDIKPANVLISQGHAVVADFGIARAVRASSGAGLTQAGMAVGTPWYMSPEQAAGDPNIDGRTDVYALGCVLYEMLTGKPPYDGPTAQSIIAKTLSAPIPHMDEEAGRFPQPIRAAVERALAKDPADRFQTPGELGDALRLDTGDIEVVDRGSRRRVRAGLVASAVVVIATVGLWLRPGSANPSTVPGADVIAVLPFSATGQDVQILGEGMVDLLSTNLNAVGGIRTIDPRVVLSRWRKQSGGGEVSLDAALTVGRDVDAGSVLTGTVVEAGSQVRFSAALHSLDGSELARVQIDGSADSILALVDTLSLRLLRATWRSREPLPSVSVSGLTTGSLDAIRAYLRGAAFYRQAQWDSAVAAFGRAVEYDSTFALAHAQRAMAYGWIQGFGTPNAVQSVRNAIALADRLPERDRSVVTAYDLFVENNMAALDTMRAYVTRYPSDAVGWHLLGDMQYHAMHLAGLTPAQYTAPFERALELDSSFSPAMVHPMDLAYQLQDSAQFYRYLNLFEDQDPSVSRYRRMAALAWAPDPAAARQALQQLLDGGPIAFASALPAAPRMRSDIRDLIMQVLDTALTLDGPVDGNLIVRALTYGGLLMATGRLDDLRSLARSLMDTGTNPLRSIGLMLLFQPIIAGYVDTTFAGAYMAQIRNVDDPLTVLLRAKLALRDGRTDDARTILGSITPPTVGEGTFQVNFATLFRAANGWADLIDGDTTAAVRRMLDAFEDFGLVFAGVTSGTGVMRIEAATALADRAATREDGLRRLEYGFLSDTDLLPLAHLRRADVLERAGQREAAALALADFIDLWRNADPVLRPRVQAARERLERLTGEPTR